MTKAGRTCSLVTCCTESPFRCLSSASVDHWTCPSLCLINAMHVFLKTGENMMKFCLVWDLFRSLLKFYYGFFFRFFFLSAAHRRETRMDGIDDKLTRFLTSYYEKCDYCKLSLLNVRKHNKHSNLHTLEWASSSQWIMKAREGRQILTYLWVWYGRKDVFKARFSFLKK